MDIFVAYIAPVLVGIGIGILSGMLGIGGGTVLVPVFRLAFDMSAIMSTATSLFTIIPTSISGAISHVRAKTCIVSLGVAAGIGGACTSPLGVWLATISPGWAIMAVAALIIGYSAVSMLRKAIMMKPAPGNASAEGAAPGNANSVGTVARAADATAKSGSSSEGSTQVVAPTADAPVKLTRRQLAIGVGIGLIAGLASGYVGVGGGFIMVPLMLSLIGIPMKQASGTSLIAVMLLAIPGVIEQGMLGNIDYMAGILVAIGSIPGAVIGARLVRKVPERILRFIFGGFLIIAAILLVLNETGVIA
ncbi:sulfite exporter TauE/SafE family protein [Raoultibacter phocaeensis]|uniref:sulfite exporter TauE/SafE family protein n=1 Tax=Raoultibacter phocaeensis TaxID=2479841 RepID=UPI00111AF473|nr:sulfite exporter TauE/SafE family protein [Raoultibacter phocaeensis]